MAARDQARWTGKKAVVNIPADPEKPWLKLAVWPGHPDAAENPVEAKVWTYGRKLVLHAKRWDGSPVTRYIKAPDGHRRVLVETWVSRTWRVPESEDAEIRDRGLALAWEFVDSPPGYVRMVGERE